ncbi:Hypothetical protein, putative, partial [Bodo saltans]
GSRSWTILSRPLSEKTPVTILFLDFYRNDDERPLIFFKVGIFRCVRVLKPWASSPPRHLVFFCYSSSLSKVFTSAPISSSPSHRSTALNLSRPVGGSCSTPTMSTVVAATLPPLCQAFPLHATLGKILLQVSGPCTQPLPLVVWVWVDWVEGNPVSLAVSAKREIVLQLPLIKSRTYCFVYLREVAGVCRMRSVSSSPFAIVSFCHPQSLVVEHGTPSPGTGKRWVVRCFNILGA